MPSSPAGHAADLPTDEGAKCLRKTVTGWGSLLSLCQLVWKVADAVLRWGCATRLRSGSPALRVERVSAWRSLSPPASGLPVASTSSGRQHASSQQLEPRPTIAHPLDQLQPIDVPLDHPTGPR